MVRDIIKNIAASDLPVYLFHDGLDAVGLPAEWVNAADDVIRQTGNSLGERMTEAFNQLFALGIERVILTGSDIPGIDISLIQSAIAAIDEYDTVIAPALDGGYCLVASKRDRFNSTIFRDIPWSTSRVLSSTRARCHAADLSYMLLDPRRDIDTLDDIQAYCKQPSPHATSTNTWLTSHGFNVSLLDSL
jgi:rSAM/selenodomain-associated transferase 1